LSMQRVLISSLRVRDFLRDHTQSALDRLIETEQAGKICAGDPSGSRAQERLAELATGGFNHRSLFRKLLRMRIFLSLAMCIAMCGCAATKTSNTGRTAMEQMLISNAVDQ